MPVSESDTALPKMSVNTPAVEGPFQKQNENADGNDQLCSLPAHCRHHHGSPKGPNFDPVGRLHVSTAHGVWHVHAGTV